MPEEKDYLKYGRQEWRKQNTKNFTVTILNEKFETFKAICDREGKTKGGLINEWIDEYIKTHS